VATVSGQVTFQAASQNELEEIIAQAIENPCCTIVSTDEVAQTVTVDLDEA
jgi:hypothetical protein